MENNYLKLIPEELSILIFSCLSNNYYLNNLYEEYKSSVEELFMYKYNTLYKVIKEMHKKLYNKTIDWETLYKDMDHINYNIIEKILNGDVSTVSNMIDFNLEDKLGLLNSSTFDIIYTCLFTKVNVGYYYYCTKSFVDSPYLMMYMYINTRLFTPELVTNLILECGDDNKLIQNFKLVLISAFMSYALNYKIHEDIIFTREFVCNLYNTFSITLDKVLINPDNDNFYQKVYDYCLSKKV